MNTHENKTEKSQCCGAEKIINPENGWSECSECFEPFFPQQNNGHFESTTPLSPKPPISPKAIEDVKEIIREYKEVTQGGECCNICVNLQSSGECVLKECICHRKPSPSEIVNSIVNKECGHTDIESNMCPDTCKDCGKILTHPSTDWEREFIEKCAQIEHIRWAKWQNYLYSFMTWNNLIGAWTLPHDKKEYWQQQINTPYQQLSESEKESDRREVRSYMPLVSHAVEEARLKGFEEGLVSSESSHTRSYEHGREQGCTEERERVRKMIEGILKSAQSLANAQNESDNNISLHLKDNLRSLLANLTKQDE